MCSQPGCSGTIVDGYCDVCGSPAPAGATGTVTSVPTATTATAGHCRQPGCIGTYVDGYCDVCGSPAPEGAASTRSASPPAVVGAPPVAGRATGAGPATGPRTRLTPPGATPPGVGPRLPEGVPAGVDAAPSTASRASNRLASTALGSARLAGTGSKTTRRVGTGSSRLRGARLGAGLTRVPPVPPVDASKAVMTNPEVAEEKRFCPSCGSPVGRSRDGQPGRLEGFCPKCRNPYSFAPKLRAGDLVGGQYEVAGALAHGGLGWIYLARDRNVSDRWVVLKGLLNSGDADAQAAAIAERQFLAQVEHPLIVEIYNFVQHGGAGYIVMEYVGGTSLKSLLKERMAGNGGRYDPFPVDQAIAYTVEVLPAFSYLHDLNLIYCDFKPDNVIQVGDAVKLIDLGGVRRADDEDSAIYGTVGFQAPEVAEVGPSVASDIYTIGRTLAVLTMEFRGYQSTYVASLPPVDATPLFQRYDSFYRLLLKACAPDPADRFGSADELRVQLLGVLREVVADRPEAGAAAHSTPSLLFDVPTVTTDEADWTHLPKLRFDETDPQAGWLHTLNIEDPRERLEQLTATRQRTAEVLLAIARAALEAGAYDKVDQATTELLTQDPWDWRAVWMSGLAGLAKSDPRAAQASFNAVYGQVPGELAPKLALAMACEESGELEVAEALYVTCARTDANYIAPSAFGLSRVRIGRDDMDGAIRALDLVPPTSRAFTRARRRKAGLLAGSGGGLATLAEAMRSIDNLTIDPIDRAQLSVDVFTSALEQVAKDGPQSNLTIAGVTAEEVPIREGLEAAYRELASRTGDRARRAQLVDAANSVRPWTMT